ncbi:uncharacterized protein LOC112461690 [Temnothorax curvispinosus]|uniref:Uncharacterized protein LOC112461690 n=1 Tax=Temnothorax curvispinosus TaxID=300111 RepID=A0A6J1QK29_9HYME|nr:uncharacterized protein LOC112461690 [Temnothorax curvispinosus]
MMQALNIDVGRNCATYCKNQDRERINLSDIRVQEATREGRIARRQSNPLSTKLQLLLRVLYMVLELTTRDRPFQLHSVHRRTCRKKTYHLPAAITFLFLDIL